MDEKLFDDIYVSRKRWEKRLYKFIFRESDSQRNEKAPTLNDRFLFIGGVGGSGKSWLLKCLNNIGQIGTKENVQKEAPVVIPVVIKIDGELFSKDGSHFYWSKVLSIMVSQIEKFFGKKKTGRKKVNQEYSINNSPTFNAYNMVYDRCIDRGDTVANQSKRYSFIVRAFTVLFTSSWVLSQFFLQIEATGQNTLLAILAVFFAFIAMIKPEVIWTKINLLLQKKTLDSVKVDFSNFDDASNLDKHDFLNSHKSLHNNPNVLIDLFKKELDKFCSKNKRRLKFVFVFDIDALPEDKKVRSRFLDMCECLTHSREEGIEVVNYEKSSAVIVVSKHRNLITEVAKDSPNYITRSLKSPLEVRSLEEGEAVKFVAAACAAWNDRNISDSGSAAYQLQKFLSAEVVNLKIKKSDSEQTKQIKKLSTFLCNGPHGLILRLPYSIRERCSYTLNFLGKKSLEELLFNAKGDYKSNEPIEQLLKNITEGIKKENGACDRLFKGMPDVTKAKNSIFLLASTDKIYESEWYILDEERVDSFEELVNKETMVDQLTDKEFGRYIILKDHVKVLVSETDDFYKTIRKDLEVIYAHLKPRLPIDTNKGSHYFLRDISLALDCFKSAAYLRVLDVGNWSVNEFNELLDWINNYAPIGDHSKLELDKIHRKSFEIFLLFFRQPKESPRYLESVLKNNQLNSLLSALTDIIENYSLCGNLRFIDLKCRAALFDIQLRLKAEILKYRYAYSFSEELRLFSAVKQEQSFPVNLKQFVEVFNSVTLLNNRLKKWNVVSWADKDSNRVEKDSEKQVYGSYSSNFFELSSLYANRSCIELDELNQGWNKLLQDFQSYKFSDISEFIQVVKVLRKLSSSIVAKNLQVTPNSCTVKYCENNILLPFLTLLSTTNITLSSENKAIISWYKARTLTYWLLNIKTNNIALTDSRLIEEWEDALNLTGKLIQYLSESELNKVIGILDVIQQVEPEKVSSIVDEIKKISIEDLQWPTCQNTLIQMARYTKELKNTELGKEIFLLFANYLLSIVSSIDIQDVNETLKLNRKIRVLFCGLAFCSDLSNDETCIEASREIKKRYLLSVIESYKVKNSSGEISYRANEAIIDEAVDNFISINFKGKDEILQRVLHVLSMMNSEYGSSEPGDFVVAKIEKIDKSGVKLFVPNSNLKVYLPKSLRPVQMHNATNSGDEGANQCSGLLNRYLLVSRIKGRNKKTGQKFVTARGAEYIGDCLHLFFPTAQNWDETNPRATRIDTNQEESKIEWDGDLWLGASNSWAVIRSSSINKSLILSNNGHLIKELQENSCIRRITVFEKSTFDDSKDTRYFEQREIIQFTNDANSELDIFFGENDEVLFCNSKSFNSDPRKNRTFLSMFNKIFDLPASIYGWEE